MFKNFAFGKNCFMENLLLEKNYFDEVFARFFEAKPQGETKPPKFLIDQIVALGQTFKNRFACLNFCDNLFDKTKNIDKSFFEIVNTLANSNAALIATSGLDVDGKNNNFEARNCKIIGSKLQEIKTNGSKIFLTLKTSLGRAEMFSDSLFLTSSTMRREFRQVGSFCLPALDFKLRKLAKKFASGATFATKSGFDGIIIDGSASNLLGEMTSQILAKRKLGYFSELIDFPKKILTNIAKNCLKMPILYKITPFLFLKETFSQNKILSLPRLKFDEDVNLVFDFMANLVGLGVDGFVIDFGTFENQFLSEYAPSLGQNLFGEFYKSIEKFFKESKVKNKFGEDVLLVCSDNFSPTIGSASDGHRMFDITKEIFADLNVIKNIFDGEANKNCIRCGVCRQFADEKKLLWCTVNPELVEKISQCKIDKNKKIAVVGAGISGCVCASILARRGYKVDLFEKEQKINRFGRLCEVFGTDKRLKNFNDYVEREVEVFAKKGQINLQKKQNFEFENASGYDTIILATGFRELFLGVPGAVLKSVVSIFDVLAKNIKTIDKKHIVIYAKTELALKLALVLAAEKHNVTIIFASENLIFELPQSLLSYYLFAAKNLNIKVFAQCEVKEISEDSVELYVNHNTEKLDFVSLICNLRGGKTYSFVPKAKIIDCNLFVYDPDIMPNNKLFYDIVTNGFLGEIYMVGDALEISNLTSEIKTAYFVGNNV